MRALIPLLLILPLTAGADIYKYVDAEGKIYFTDAPLQGGDLKLEWKRDANKVAKENTAKVLAIGRSRPFVESAPADLSARRARYERIIELVASQENLRPELLHAVVRTESAYNPVAVSPAGATGLMQLMPATRRATGWRTSTTRRRICGAAPAICAICWTCSATICNWPWQPTTPGRTPSPNTAIASHPIPKPSATCARSCSIFGPSKPPPTRAEPPPEPSSWRAHA